MLFCISVNLKFFTLFLLFGTKICQSAKILIYTPSISRSHIVMSGRIADILVKSGHDVVLFIPEYDPDVKLNGTKLAKIWRMTNISRAYIDGIKSIENDLFNSPTLGYNERFVFEDTVGDMCEAVMTRHNELEIIRNYNFDLAITECLDLCGVGIVRYLGISNHIWHSTTPLHDYVTFNMGIPYPLSYIPTSEENFAGPKMTLFERAKNFYMYFVALKLHHYGTEKSTITLRKYAGKNFPHVRDIAAESSIVIVNSDEFWDAARPVLHKFIYIGGLGMEPAKSINEPFLSLLENPDKKGVILFSLGTVAPTSGLSSKLKSALVQTFAYFSDYQFIVKIDKGDEEWKFLAKQSENNIFTTHWMPQSDILGHRNLKLFITHGGLNSLLEASVNGIPLIVIPLFADQYRNSKNVEYRELGIIVNKLRLATNDLKLAISTVLYNNSYRTKAKRIQHLMQNKPFKPEDLLIKWVNFVCATGSLPELTPESVHLTFVQYYFIDVVLLFIVLPLLTTFALVYLTVRRYFSTSDVKIKLN